MHLTGQAIGLPLDRIDGLKKVTGSATYAYEYPVEGTAYAFALQSAIAKGRVVSIDASSARELPGVLAVLSQENAPRLAPLANAELAVFQSDAIAYRGQFVAAVVAETFEIARQAASLIAAISTSQSGSSGASRLIHRVATS
jgi:xanthine dehydrogenase YagR molybdenum-binding subunit